MITHWTRELLSSEFMVSNPAQVRMFSLYFAALPSLWASDGGLGETHRAYLYTFVV